MLVEVATEWHINENQNLNFSSQQMTLLQRALMAMRLWGTVQLLQGEHRAGTLATPMVMAKPRWSRTSSH